MRKYIPYALILIAFLLGQFLGTQDKSGEELLKRKFEQEREYDIQESKRKDSIITALEAESGEIRAELVQTLSLYADSLQRNQRAYMALKRKYNEINLSRASADKLDSIITALYGRR